MYSAYKKAGLDSVLGFRKVLECLMDDKVKAQFDDLLEQ
jgi:hypothetical protein